MITRACMELSPSLKKINFDPVQKSRQDGDQTQTSFHILYLCPRILSFCNGYIYIYICVCLCVCLCVLLLVCIVHCMYYRYAWTVVANVAVYVTAWLLLAEISIGVIEVTSQDQHVFFVSWTQITKKNIGSILIRHRSEEKVSDRCLIDGDPMVIAIWETMEDAIHTGDGRGFLNSCFRLTTKKQQSFAKYTGLLWV